VSGGFKVEVDDNFRHLQKAWKKAPEMVTEELTASIYEAELLLQREVVEHTPKGVGQGGGIAGSIIAMRPDVSTTGVLGVVGTPLNYAPAVELGTKPHMPPVKPITDWVVSVLGLSKEEAKSVAWAVAMKIKRKGTEGAHMFREGFKATEGQMQLIFVRCNERVATRLAGIPNA
jgi:hypothetical protein